MRAFREEKGKALLHPCVPVPVSNWSIEFCVLPDTVLEILRNLITKIDRLLLFRLSGGYEFPVLYIYIRQI